MSEEQSKFGKVVSLLEILKNPKFNKVNSHYQNDYADLESILSYVKPHISGCGLVLRQTLQEDMFVSQLLDKEDGEPILACAVPFIPQAQTPQAVGSAITYSRRYGLLLLLNLVGEADDDGELAEGRGGKKTTPKKRTKKAKPAPKPVQEPAAKADEQDTDGDW